jgi:hypothetical protein
LRASPQRILEVSRRLFPEDVKTAHRVGVRAADLLRTAYLRDPPALCGRTTNALIAGALYVAAMLEKEWVSQRGVAEACNVSEVSIRNSYRNLIKVLGLEGRLLVKIEPTPELRDVGVKPYYYPKVPRERHHEGSPPGSPV